jgi:hypothetical protein
LKTADNADGDLPRADRAANLRISERLLLDGVDVRQTRGVVADAFARPLTCIDPRNGRDSGVDD